MTKIIWRDSTTIVKALKGRDALFALLDLFHSLGLHIIDLEIHYDMPKNRTYLEKMSNGS